MVAANQRIDERNQSPSSSTEFNYSANGRTFAANEEVQFAHAPMCIRSVARPKRIKWKPACIVIIRFCKMLFKLGVKKKNDGSLQNPWKSCRTITISSDIYVDNSCYKNE